MPHINLRQLFLFVLYIFEIYPKCVPFAFINSI
uniref:Uncharacterized protein n=1 Tax=Anguilla anguilla TaxID=7936 RepID=A0A0E9Y2A3_ANGAN